MFNHKLLLASAPRHLAGITLLFCLALLLAPHSLGAAIDCTSANDCQPALIYFTPIKLSEVKFSPIAQLDDRQGLEPQGKSQQPVASRLARLFERNLHKAQLLDTSDPAPSSERELANPVKTDTGSPTAIHESSPLALMVLGLLGLILARRRVRGQV